MGFSVPERPGLSHKLRTLIIKNVFQFSTSLESRLVIILRAEYKLNKSNNNIRLFLCGRF